MSRLEIRIDGITRTKLERAQQQNQPDSRREQWVRQMPLGPSILRLSPFGLTIAVVVLAAVIADVSTPAARIGPVPLRARHLLFMWDDSAGAAQLTTLEDAGIVVDSVNPSGGGDGITGRLGRVAAMIGGTLPASLADELPKHPGVDAVYVFSSFAQASDPARLAELRALVRKNGIRLYLHTVDQPPSPALLAIAKESGGGLLNPSTK
jgi:hypothetical protein